LQTDRPILKLDLIYLEDRGAIECVGRYATSYMEFLHRIKRFYVPPSQVFLTKYTEFPYKEFYGSTQKKSFDVVLIFLVFSIINPNTIFFFALLAYVTLNSNLSSTEEFL
jgi:hypothetical protein